MTGGGAIDAANASPTTVRTCPKCRAAVVSGDRYCAGCGLPFDRACGRCATLLLSDDRFCPECGEDAPPLAGPAEAPDEFWSGPIRRLRAGLMGRYRVTHKLGQGGQAAVYLAEELSLRRRVAVKVLAPGRFVSEKAVERFEREARTIASLSHPNIVTIYSVGTHEDLHYFVMQYVEGRSLAAILAERGQLPLAAIRAVAFQVGSALQYAFEKKGIVHRDIKPANVLFDEEGHAILTDFGIAKDATNGTLRLTEMALGTPSYMSPEQCLEKSVSWSSDQYALGIVIYEMLTGRVPFEGSNLEVMNGHTKLPPPPIRRLRPDCPVEMEWAVLRMLEKRPEDRWPTMPDALRQLGATPLSRDDPVRGEIRRLALGTGAPVEAMVTPTGPVRVEVRVAERLELGDRAPLHAFSVIGQGGNPQPLEARWEVDPPSLATVEGTPPVLVAHAPGRVRVTGRTAIGSSVAEVEILPTPVDKVVLSAPVGSLDVGQEMQASVEAYDRRGNRLPLPVTWRSSEPAIASVDAAGRIRALADGRTRITAVVGGVSDERVVYVERPVGTTVRVTSTVQQLGVGETTVLAADVVGANGALLPDAQVRWSSSNSAVASVDDEGRVAARAAGTVVITARSGVASGSSELAVSPGRSDARADDHGVDSLPVSASFEAFPTGTATRPPSERWRGWRWAVLAVPLVLLATVVWQGWGRWGRAHQPQSPASLSLARAFFSPSAVQHVTNLGYAFEDSDVRDEFESDAGDRGPTRGGRLVLSQRPFSMFPEAWTKSSRNFAAHFSIRLDSGDADRFGGFAFRIGAAPSGGSAGYFLFLRAGASPASGLSFFDGKRYTDVVPRAQTSSLRTGDNAIDAMVVGGRFYLFVNSEQVMESPLLNKLSGTRFGLFGDSRAHYSFDDLVVVGLYRR